MALGSTLGVDGIWARTGPGDVKSPGPFSVSGVPEVEVVEVERFWKSPAVPAGSLVALAAVVGFCAARGLPWWLGPAGFVLGFVAVPVAECVLWFLDRIEDLRGGGSVG